MREPPRRGTVTSVTCPFTLTRQLNSLAGPGITSNVTPEYSLLDAGKRERERGEPRHARRKLVGPLEERCYLFSLYMAIVRTVFRWSSIWNTSTIDTDYDRRTRMEISRSSDARCQIEKYTDLDRDNDRLMSSRKSWYQDTRNFNTRRHFAVQR